MDELLKKMQKIGFTIYEAKIYIALLQQNPATGYEISKLSGVPHSKVYENIARLANSGIVLAIGSEPSKYVPLPPEELLKNAQAGFEKSLDFLREALPALSRGPKADYVWNIKGYDLTMEKAREMIRETKKELIVSIWENEALCLQGELAEAVGRGVEVNVLLYGKAQIDGVSNIHHHGSEESLKQRVGGRWLTLVVDSKEVLTGQIDKKSDGISIYTSNPSIVFISSRAIEHEIYISKKIDRSDEYENR